MSLNSTVEQKIWLAYRNVMDSKTYSSIFRYIDTKYKQPLFKDLSEVCMRGFPN
jgi:hypothetical protein